MKRTLISVICFALAACVLFCGCVKGDNEPDAASVTETAPAAAETAADTDAPSATEPEPSAAPAATEPVPEVEHVDPYSLENSYDADNALFVKQEGVDYGTIVSGLTYHSTAAGDDKQCVVLLPAGFDESRTYPVMYVLHGFNGGPEDLLNKNSYLVIAYGNMLAEGSAVPMMIVAVDMYTGPAAERYDKYNADLKECYNKVIEDIKTDLMPFIEATYPVSASREDTAVAGISEGAGKALCIGFTWPEEFGWIGAFSPNAGVIPTEFDEGTFWNDPVMQDFPELTEDEIPLYLYLAVGSEDTGSMGPTLYYRDVLGERGIMNQTDLVEGFDHNTRFWRQCFCNYLAKVFR